MRTECHSLQENEEKSRIKCVVWDLDNTLWQGTLLEGDDLILMPGTKAIIQELDSRGILQSVASKNDYQPAWEKIQGFGLDEYFLYPQISWGNKSDSIKAIATKLGIGFDTFAFVDDQVFERDEVRFSLPEVTIIDAADIEKLLDTFRMQPRFVTIESRMRRKMYQADIRRRECEDEFPGTKDEFLKSLGMCMTIRVAREIDLRRAEELTIRTNQLNTTGRTYSYQELNQLLDSSNHLLLVAELEDKYGTSGIIGLALIEQTLDVWLLKLLIMSCRVMTRGVGNVMISYILQSAKRHGVRMLAEFIANERNRMMYITYKFSGFQEVERQDGLVLLEHNLESVRPFPHYIIVRSTDEK